MGTDVLAGASRGLERRHGACASDRFARRGGQRADRGSRSSDAESEEGTRTDEYVHRHWLKRRRGSQTGPRLETVSVAMSAKQESREELDSESNLKSIDFFKKEEAYYG